jgi:hypothetical protein
MLKNFLSIIVPFMRCGKMWQNERGHRHNMAQAHYALDNEGHAALIATVTMVTRTRLHVTFIRT